MSEGKAVAACIFTTQWIGLESLDGKSEWNARTFMGDREAEGLEHNRIYTWDELRQRRLAWWLGDKQGRLKCKRGV